MALNVSPVLPGRSSHAESSTLLAALIRNAPPTPATMASATVSYPHLPQAPFRAQHPAQPPPKHLAVASNPPPQPLSSHPPTPSLSAPNAQTQPNAPTEPNVSPAQHGKSNLAANLTPLVLLTHSVLPTLAITVFAMAFCLLRLFLRVFRLRLLLLLMVLVLGLRRLDLLLLLLILVVVFRDLGLRVLWRLFLLLLLGLCRWRFWWSSIVVLVHSLAKHLHSASIVTSVQLSIYLVYSVPMLF